VALLGTLASVLVITFLAAVVTRVAELSGLSESSYQTLSVTAEAIDPRGGLIDSVVIGALGVLDDVTEELTAAHAARGRRSAHENCS